jgi:ABC-type polysaccharide/polyol phosphate export permease
MKGIFDLNLYLVSLFQCVLIFFIGFYIFKKLSYRFAEVL